MPAQLESLYGFLQGTFRRTAPVVGDAELESECATRATGNDRLTPAEQVDIYRRQFWLRHFDCLREDYPGLYALVGDDAFDDFCTAYLVAYPPCTPSLRDLGEDIVRFAEGYSGFADDIAWAARDMIRYENAFVPIFDGPEPPRLDPAKLQAMPPEAWETARIILNPLMARMRIEAPVHTIRVALKAGRAPELPPPRRPICLVLFRRDYRVQFEEIEPLAFDFLEALARGQALVPACEALTAAAGPEKADEINAKVGTWFQQWASWGWIVDIAL